MLHHRSIAAPALIASALVTGSASADLIQYTFTFAGATGSIGSGPTVDMVGGFTLLADTDDIGPGTPEGHVVSPLSGFVTFNGDIYDMDADFVADTALWTYSNETYGVEVGFGTYVPFEDLISTGYDVPLGWDLATPFNANSNYDNVDGLFADGIQTEAGAFRVVPGFNWVTLEATLVPVPGLGGLGAILIGLAGPMRSGRRRC